MRISSTLIAALLLGLPYVAKPQSLVGGFMNGKGRGAVALSYTAEKYDDAFLVPEDADDVPIFNKMNFNSVSLYATYGISANLDFVLNLPYIQAKGHAARETLEELEYENTRSGLQDISIFFKYKLNSFKVGKNRLDVVAMGGVKTPVSNYAVNDGLQSIVAIGNRATNITSGVVTQLRAPLGIYIAAQGGYSYRTGEVPDAVVGELKIGYGTKLIHVTGWYAKQISLGGVDIVGNGFTGFFPATDVSFTRAGANVYVPIASGFGLSGGVSQYVSGRNVGKSTGYSASIVFTF
jgi:hypothetical protein